MNYDDLRHHKHYKILIKGTIGNNFVLGKVCVIHKILKILSLFFFYMVKFL